MQDVGSNQLVNYSTFLVDNERSKYRLTVTGYSGNTGGDVAFMTPNNLNVCIFVYSACTMQSVKFIIFRMDIY